MTVRIGDKGEDDTKGKVVKEVDVPEVETNQNEKRTKREGNTGRCSKTKWGSILLVSRHSMTMSALTCHQTTCQFSMALD